MNLPPPDAIQEFKVQTSNFSAEFGRAGGAVVNAALKSGSNSLHGDAWEFLRNDMFDAIDVSQYFAGTNRSKGELRRNQFGGALGGPVVKNKLFFFGDYEGTRIRTGAELSATVPTAAEVASGYLNYQDWFTQSTKTFADVEGRTFNQYTIFDPATTRQVGNGAIDSVTDLPVACPNGAATCYVRDPFYTGGSIVGMTNFATAGQMALMNILPSNRIDQNALNILKLYPAANGPSISGSNYFVNRSQPDDNDHFDTRMDFNLSEHDQLFGHVSYGNRRAFFPGAISGDGNNTGFGQGNFVDKSINVAVSETHTFTPTLINEARFGYSHLYTFAQPPSSLVSGIPAKYGIQGVPQDSGNGGLPTIDISGLTSLGAGAFASPNVRTSDTLQFTENLTKVHGGHSFKVGFEYQRLHFPWTDPAWSRGEFSFGGYTGMTPGVGGATTSGIGEADLLLTPMASTVTGGVNNVGGPNGVYASNITNLDDLRHYYGSYFQDDWKVNSKLTINMGLRWEIFGAIGAGNGEQAGLSLTSGGAEYLIPSSKQSSGALAPAFTTLLTKDNIQLKYVSGSSIMTTPLTNFAPRVGLAYQFTPKLVARLGYGIFYGGFENIGGSPDPGYNYPWAVNLSFFAPSGNILPITYPNGQNATLEGGLASANPDPTSPNFSPNGLGLVGYETPWKTSNTQEWNGSLQYQISQSQSVTVAYVGNNTHHLLNGEKRNIPDELLPPGTDVTPYLPFPDFGQNSDYLTARGSAYYESFQVTYEHRFSHGMSLLANYTRSVCKSDFRNILGSFGDNQFNRAPTLVGFPLTNDYSYCGSDVPNIFHASGVWQLPIGRGQAYGKDMSRALDAVVGGWSAQGIVTSQNGFPFTIGCATGTSAGNFNCYAPISGDPYANKGAHGIAPFLNAAAFVQPPSVTSIGQTDFAPLGGPWNQVHGPSFNDLDFSIFKKFQTTERTNLEFRAEFFNLFNHPNFGTGMESTNYNNANFGIINSTRGIGREVQFALKFIF